MLMIGPWLRGPQAGTCRLTTISAVAPHKAEELCIRDVAEELFKKPRFRPYIAEERVTLR